MKHLRNIFLFITWLVLIILLNHLNEYILIYQAIINHKDNYEIKVINGIVDNDYFVPGICGKKVNILKSLIKMKKENMYHPKYYIYDLIKPNNLLKDNLNKTIKYGNSSKRSIAIIKDLNCDYNIEPLILTHDNYLLNKNYIVAGSIIYLDDSLTSNDLNYLYYFINSKGLNILSLDNLLKE